jgi:opacity protein-like surface antigen
MKRMSLAALASLAFLIPAVAADAAAPDATITLSGGSVAVGIGYTWGDGMLLFKGRSYPFTVSGLSVIDIGIAKIDGRGDVFNLSNVADFPGTYIAAGIGATIAGGGSVAAMENQNGVIIHFRSTTAGLKLNLSPAGIVFKLKNPVDVSQK